jgi:ABC-type Fe3+-siderophore transport system permease subunit
LRRRVFIAAGIAGMALLMFGVTAMAQDGTPVVEPTIGLLASAAGLSIVIAVIMNLLRNSPLFPSPELFNKWAPSLAALIGVVGAVAYAITSGDPVTGESLISAVLVGIFAGGYSQNVNTILTRTVTPAEELPE